MNKDSIIVVIYKAEDLLQPLEEEKEKKIKEGISRFVHL